MQLRVRQDTSEQLSCLPYPVTITVTKPDLLRCSGLA